MADFIEGTVRPRAVEHGRDHVLVRFRGGLQRGQRAIHGALIAPGAERGAAAALRGVGRVVHLEDIHGVVALHEEVIDAHDHPPVLLDLVLQPERALREYGEMILKSRMVYDAVFDNKYVRNFFAGVPGLYEWAVLGKAWFHSIENLPDGRPRFDVVLFDAPATGHGLDMLRVPKVIVDIVPPGILRRDAERARPRHAVAREGVHGRPARVAEEARAPRLDESLLHEDLHRPRHVAAEDLRAVRDARLRALAARLPRVQLAMEMEQDALRRGQGHRASRLRSPRGDPRSRGTRKLSGGGNYRDAFI